MPNSILKNEKHNRDKYLPFLAKNILETNFNDSELNENNIMSNSSIKNDSLKSLIHNEFEMDRSMVSVTILPCHTQQQKNDNNLSHPSSSIFSFPNKLKQVDCNKQTLPNLILHTNENISFKNLTKTIV